MARAHPTARREGIAALAAMLTAAASDTLPWTGESAAGANQPNQHGYSDLLRWNPADDAYAEL
ncbi:hypothetical protein ABZ897_55950 [Nonomuraea sp. NPDC046802]|uniref:hypothetical protein n=1 Tax=Nonomuraea sp. NPDC046802 TaxID=3154919 RepID=UPI0033EA85E8